jgi:hypothetical protein
MFALAACAKNTFLVEDPKGFVRTATLQICGSEAPLHRAGKTWKLTHSISCKGSGEIRLMYHDGGPEHCTIGYVTGDARQQFRFRAEQSACSPIT